jgi:hypothetical protein
VPAEPFKGIDNVMISPFGRMLIVDRVPRVDNHYPWRCPPTSIEGGSDTTTFVASHLRPLA